MKKIPIRICIYPKDIQKITGRSERYARELLYRIRRAYQKADHQFVSIEEFCQYTGLDPNAVRELIID